MALKLNGTNSVAAPAYAGDDADTGLQCGTNELKLVTGGTARATVDSSGDVMIGTTSNNAHADADNLIVGSTGGTHQGMTINGSTSSQIRFADSGSNTAGYIIYSHSADNLQFATNGSERMRIDSSGNVGINSANPPSRLHLNIGADQTWAQIDKSRAANEPMLQLIHSAGNRDAKIRFANSQGSWCVGIDGDENLAIKSGETGTGGGGTTRARFTTNGLCFGGDTAAANALDDYEEGDWTPASYQNFNGVSNADGEYVKIGRYVTVQFQFQYSSLGAAGQSSAISGLPFTVANVNPNTGVEATSIAFGTNKDVTLWAEGGTNYLYFRTGSPAVGSQSSGADFFRGSISYMTS